MYDPASHARSTHEGAHHAYQCVALRGLRYEFGIVLPQGHRVLLKRVQEELAKAQEQARLPRVVQRSGSTSSHRQPPGRYRPTGQTAGLDGQAEPAHVGTASHLGHWSIGVYRN